MTVILFFFVGMMCEALDAPTYGGVTNNTAVNSQAIYSCNPGFALVGQSSRICQANGTWSGEEPLCEFDLHGCSLHYYGNVLLERIAAQTCQMFIICSTRISYLRIVSSDYKNEFTCNYSHSASLHVMYASLLVFHPSTDCTVHCSLVLYHLS